MLIRILYRLLLQRLGQRQAFRASPAAFPPGPRVPAEPPDDRRRWLRIGFAIPLAAAIALGVIMLRVNSPSVPDHAGVAELRLEITGVTPEPLVVYLTGAGLPRPEPAPAPSELPQITSVNGDFMPRFQVLSADITIEVLNADPIPHNTHVFNRGETVFNVGLPLAGIVVKKTLTGAEIFNVRCDIHPWMQAWMFVPPTRYFAVLYEADSVTFADIPPGEYVLHLWQPGRTENLQTVTLAPGETESLRLR